MRTAEDFIVPWVKSAEPYSDKHMDIAWENPGTIRMMSNENLLGPSESVLEAIVEAARVRAPTCARSWEKPAAFPGSPWCSGTAPRM
jgi:histidinol-phosphate/aromatic aminotransferase/cobyric acid decarboxylase-like protein